MNALLTGEVDAGWSGIPNVVSLIKTGKLRALCISILRRDESLPEVPTCDELGYKGFDVATVLGLQSSAGMPPTIVAKLRRNPRGFTMSMNSTVANTRVARVPLTAARLSDLDRRLAGRLATSTSVVRQAPRSVRATSELRSRSLDRPC